MSQKAQEKQVRLKEELVRKGVVLPHPDSVYFEESLDSSRIGQGTVIHPGCRIRGKSTSIGPDCAIGEDGPATVTDCVLGKGVQLKAGSFNGSVFMDESSFGPGAYIRPGCLLEEQSSCGHCVGLKQTILLPFVTVGSLVNFCDCLMAGGTDRKNHSEVGSSFIHFNYTPNQDKATPSLIGDIPRGVMLDQRPIFLGGQAGIVGPSVVEYGTLLAAGTILRRDIAEEGKLVLETGHRARSNLSWEPGKYSNLSRVFRNNFLYIGNLHALLQWYGNIRERIMKGDPFRSACVTYGAEIIRTIIKERVSRLGKVIEAARTAGHDELGIDWDQTASRLTKEEYPEELTGDRDAFMECVGHPAKPYVEVIRALSAEAKAQGTRWLKSVVDSVAFAVKA